VLIGRRSGVVVVIAPLPAPWAELHAHLAAAFGPPAGAIGVGSAVTSVQELPRSAREAAFALGVRQRSRVPGGVTGFDGLGLYRFLAAADDTGEAERFIRQWLGPLIDYDEHHRADLVETLGTFLDCGGGHQPAAARLGIHRSTLRYRLERIRTLGPAGLDDVDVRLNLHLATRAWRLFRKEA
jgi:DNA-binding PucR family transcriptional regulator